MSTRLWKTYDNTQFYFEEDDLAIRNIEYDCRKSTNVAEEGKTKVLNLSRFQRHQRPVDETLWFCMAVNEFQVAWLVECKGFFQICLIHRNQMSQRDIVLHSVYWLFGLFMTPKHFWLETYSPFTSEEVYDSTNKFRENAQNFEGFHPCKFYNWQCLSGVWVWLIRSEFGS